MKMRIKWMPYKTLGILLICGGAVCWAGPGEVDRRVLVAEFADPPRSCAPWMWQFWRGESQRSEKAIAEDLQALADAGFGGVTIMDIAANNNDLNVMEPAWVERVAYAVRECGRLGLEVKLGLSEMWSSGGSWVGPEHALKRFVVATREIVSDGKGMSVEIPFAANDQVEGYVRDVALLAVPTVPAAEGGLRLDGADGTALFDASPETFLPLDLDKDVTLHFKLPGMLPVASIILEPYREFGPAALVLDDGKPQKIHLGAPLVLPVNREISEFTLTIDTKNNSPDHYGDFAPECAALSGVSVLLKDGRVLGQQLPLLNYQTARLTKLSSWDVTHRYQPFLLQPMAALKGVPAASIVSLPPTDLQGNEATVTLPPGTYTLVRFGYTLSEKRIIRKDSREIDKLSAEATRFHYNHMIAPLKTLLGGSLAGKNFWIHEDSWELTPYNWTPKFLEDFERIAGYSMVPWLPVFAGMVVEDRAASLSFLRDYRKVVSELIVENHYAELQKLAASDGARFGAEAAGPSTFYVDSAKAKGAVDEPMGEFWVDGFGNEALAFPLKKDGDIFEAGSIAEVYGKRWAGAEAFTSHFGDWSHHPKSLKVFGDLAYAAGLNRFHMHASTLQREGVRPPGILNTSVGSNFQRTATWWPFMADWVRYMSRCQLMLSQGRMVADGLYLADDTPPAAFVRRDNFDFLVKPPFGNQALGCDMDYFAKAASVKDGQIVFPSGSTQKYLVLPDLEKLPAETVKKARDFAASGVPVFAREAGDGFLSYSDAKAWFSKQNWEPQFAADTDAIAYQARQDGDRMIYWVVNTSTATQNVTAFFRDGTGSPQIWDPETGTLEPVRAFQPRDHGGFVALSLYPHQAVFVVFDKANPVPMASDISLAGARLNADGHVEGAPRFESGVPPLADGTALEPAGLNAIWKGPWRVGFAAGQQTEFPALSDWRDHPDEHIKYFSGTARYDGVVAVDWKAVPGERLYLDLGGVDDYADVWLNGERLPRRLFPPYRYDITALLRQGDNAVRVDVTNQWLNRRIGDRKLPKEKQVAWAEPSWRREPKEDASLLPSGLKGPVRIERFVPLMKLE